MKKMYSRFLFFPLLLFTLFGCRDEVYFDRPVYLRGNAYEYLKEKGNYTYFIQALEITNFSAALDGRGLYSVFAPDDDAFKRFLVKHSKNSLEDFNVDSLKMMISYHLIEFSFNRDDFDAFTATASAEEPEEGDGTCYKFETLAQEAFKAVKDPTAGGHEKDVFNQRKFLPVISTTLLKTQESTDYESDYKMFFPNINWQGDHKKIYVANAAVVESGIPIDNGYMYLVDEVIDLLPTVYQSLDQSNNAGHSYKIFQELYDKFAYFYYDAEKTRDFAELGDSLFLFYHYLSPSTMSDDLPDLACEWTVAESGADYEDRLKFAINCFAPNDEVLGAYIKEFFKDKDGNSYSFYNDLPLLNLFYLLRVHAATRETLILPSLIDQGLEGIHGEKHPLTRKNIDIAKFCSNGVLYGIDQVFEPTMFSLVMEPLFKYGHFSTMLNIVHKQGVLLTMVDPERKYTIFTVSDDILMEKYGYYAKLDGNASSHDLINERVVIKRYLDSDIVDDEIVNDSEVNMTMEEQRDFMFNHIVDDYISVDMNSNKRQFYSTKDQYRFIYTEGNALFGEDKTEMDIKKTWESDNYIGDGKGVVHELYDKFGKNENNIGKELMENSAQYREFYQALLAANLLQIVPEDATTAEEIEAINMDWAEGERLMVFAPTNEAWDEARFPADSLERDKFLKFFFVPMIANKLTDYILPNYGRENEEISTYSSVSSLVMKTIGVNFVDDTRLLITNGDGISVETDGEVPFFATDGIIFGINELLIPGKDK